MGTVLRTMVFAGAWALAGCGAVGVEDAAAEASSPGVPNDGAEPALPSTDEFKEVVPSTANMLAVSRGDIDADGSADVVLAIDSATDAQHARSLLLLVRREDGRLRLAARNDRIVPCAACGGSLGVPSIYLDSDTGVFTLTTEGGTGSLWSNEYVFEHKGGDRWLLRSFTRTTSNRTGDETEQSKLTSNDLGDIDFVEFDPEDLH